MKIVLLTSDSLRHKFIAAEISKQLDLKLIVAEINCKANFWLELINQHLAEKASEKNMGSH